jgi:hypothetical protein
MTMGGILVSGKMIDILQNFDLGKTQVLELPMYEGLGKQLSPSSPLEEPDLSKPIPGRWGVLHVTERKDAVVESECRNVDDGGRSPKGDIQYIGVPYRGKETQIALDARAALEGADLWFDARIRWVPFISDRLRHALQAEGLRVPTLKWLREARLI